MSSEYRVNKTTGQVVKDDGTGWKPVASVRSKTTGEILIDEGNGWQPMPGAQRALQADRGMTMASERANQAMASGQRIAPDDLTQLGRPDFSSAAMARLPAPTMSAADMDAFDAQKRLEKERLRVPDSNFKERSILALNTPTFGSGPRFAAGMQTIGALAATPFVEGDIIDQKGISGATSQFLDEARIHQRRGREERPMESLAIEVVPGIAQGKTIIDTLGKQLLPKTNTLSNVGRVVGVGTGYGAAYAGSQNESGTLEGVAGDAALGGAVGAGFGLGFKAAEPILTAGTRSAKTAGASIYDALSGLMGKAGGARDKVAEEVAVAAVRRSAERSGMTVAQMLDLAKKYKDKPAVLAEIIGQDAINSLTALTRRSGTTPQKAQDIITERMGGFPARAADDLRQTTGLTDAQIRGEFGPELAARREAAAPAYTELFEQQGGVTSDRLTQLSGTNTLGPLIRRSQAAAEDLAVTQRRDPARVTPLEVLDLAKRELDDEIATAQRNKQNSELFRLQSLQTALLGELDELTGGAYAAARDLGGEAPRLQAARAQGEQALRPSVTRATVNEQVGALNPQDRPAFASGTASVIDESIAGGRMLPQQFRLPANREKVQAAFGKEAGGEFANRMTAEAELREMGSRWGPRMNSVTGTVMESGATQMGDDLVNAGMNLATGNKVGLVRQAINFMRQRGFSQRQIDAIGDLLLSSPEEGLKRLNLMAPDGPPAGLAAPLAGGGAPPQAPAPLPTGAPVPPPKPPGLGTRIADGAAVATLGLQGGTAEADTGEASAELQSAMGRVTDIESQISKLDNETIPTLEEQIRLLQDHRADPKEKQRILIARGHKLGEYGPNRDGVDGVITSGSYSANAIVSEVAKIEADIARRRNEREGYAGELDKGRGEINDIRVREANQDDNPANPWIDKGLEFGAYGAALYGAHRFRNRGLRKSDEAAKAVQDKANALLTRLPVPPDVPAKTLLSRIPIAGNNERARIAAKTKAATKASRAVEDRLSGKTVPPISPDPTSPDGLPTRIENLQQFYRQGGAEGKLPLEDLGNGQFAPRTDAMPDYRLYGPKGPIGRFMEPVTSRFRTGDAAVMGAGTTDAVVMEGMLEKTRDDIVTTETELAKAQEANDGKGDATRIKVAKDRLKELRNIETLQTTAQRIGIGLVVGGGLGVAHGKYARPEPRFEAAGRERQLINQAILPAPTAPPPVGPLLTTAPPAPPPPLKKPRTRQPKPKPPVAITSGKRPPKPNNDND